MTLLLDVLTINTGLAATVIAAVIASVTAIGLAFLKYADGNNSRTTEQIIKKLDDITGNQRELELELRPLATTLAEHSVELRNIKETLSETNKWVNNHDTRI